MLRQITAGFAYVAKNADLRTISLLTAAQTIIWGALSVFMVVIAVATSARPRASAGSRAPWASARSSGA